MLLFCLSLTSLPVCSHRRPLPVDGGVRQHGEGVEPPGLDAAQDAGWSRGEGSCAVIGCRSLRLQLIGREVDASLCVQVMGVDVSPDGKLIATSSYDRTFKLWLSE